MALGSDVSQRGSSRIYRKQQPAGATLNGNTVVSEEYFDSGSLVQFAGLVTVNGVLQPAFVKYTIAATGNPGDNKVRVTAQIVDGMGTAIAGQAFNFDFWLSDAATGVGLTAVTASGGIAVSTGTQIAATVAAKFLRVQCDAAGKVVVDITDTAKTGFYAAVQLPSLSAVVISRQLVAGDYS